MLTVKVLGPGCANCRRLEQMVHRAADSLSLPVEIEKVTDYPTIMGYGVLATPGLVVNERLVSSGRLPSPGEITTWLTAEWAAPAS